MRSILIATDGSPGSDAAVAAGIELGREADAGSPSVYVRQPIGSRRLGAVAGTLLGSVSRAVVRGVEQPTLVVKEPQPNPREVARGAERAGSAS